MRRMSHANLSRISMKRSLVFAASVLAWAATGSGAFAQEVTARVVSVSPIVEQMPVTRNACQDEAVTVPGGKSGGGALIGGIAGGALGNAVGHGSGRAAATVLGALGGAIMGDRIEGASAQQTQYQQRCYPQASYENQTTAYNVIYELGGQRFSVQMPRDPGPTIQVRLTPLPPTSSYYPTPQRYPSAPAYPYPSNPHGPWEDD